MTITAHVAVSPLTGERHTMILMPVGRWQTRVWLQSCQSGYWFLKCACMDDEGCVAE